MKALIHIGYSKTGTKWLQNSFFPFVTNASFVNLYFTNKFFLNTDVLDFDSEKVKLDIIKVINLDKTIKIFSSEFLTTPITYGWHYGYYSFGIAQKIKSVFPDATVIIFIRRQQSLIPSAYQQYVKNGGTFSFRRWLYSGEVFSFEHLLYDRLIEYYKSLFSDKQVRVYLYEDFKNDSKQFIHRFSLEHGLEVDWDKVTYSPVNKGLRIYCMPILKAVNHFYKKPVGRKRFVCHIPGMTSVGRGVIKYLNPMPIFGHYLTENEFLRPKDMEYIKNFYANSNRNLTRYFDSEVLEQYGYFL